MALGECRSCGNGCSKDAKICPHCGQPDPVLMSDAQLIFWLGLFGFVCIFGFISKACDL